VAPLDATFKPRLPSSSLPPLFPSYSFIPSSKMIITIEPREGDLLHHSSTVMSVLVIVAGIYSLSYVWTGGRPRLTSLCPVLLLFGAGTFVHHACRRWSEEASSESTEDTRTHSPRPPVFRKPKVCFPASGVNRAHAKAGQGPSLPHGPHPSRSKRELGR
jgi:hypothetical protein